MSVKYNNNSSTTLSSAASGGAVTLNVVDGSVFPVLGAEDHTYVTVEQEVVKVTAIAGNVLSCEPTGSSHDAGSQVELRMTSELLEDAIEDVLDNTEVENDFMNGALQVWQRGSTYPGGNSFFPDRIKFVAVGSTNTITQNSFAINASAVPGVHKYFNCSVTAGAGTSDYVLVFHRIMDVKKHAGKKIAISFSGKCSVANDVAIVIAQNFGTGGGVAVNTAAGKVSLTTSWGKKTVFVDVPEITETSLGDDHFMQITFYFDAGSDKDSTTSSLGHQSGLFSMADFRVYPSPKGIELPVRRKDTNEELRNCQAFYQKSYSLADAPGAVEYDGSQSVIRANNLTAVGVKFNTPMYRAPSIVRLYSPVSGTINTVYHGGGDIGSVTPYNIGENSIGWIKSASGAFTSTTGTVDFHYTADTDL